MLHISPHKGSIRVLQLGVGIKKGITKQVRLRIFQINKLLLLRLCVGGIISLIWFSKELKNNLSKNNRRHRVILILFVCESLIRWVEVSVSNSGGA
jgi:hypothetical protein